VSLHFQLKLHAPGSLSVPTDKKRKGPESTHCWAIISRTKYLWKYVDMKYFRCFGVRHSLLKAFYLHLRTCISPGSALKLCCSYYLLSQAYYCDLHNEQRFVSCTAPANIFSSGNSVFFVRFELNSCTL